MLINIYSVNVIFYLLFIYLLLVEKRKRIDELEKEESKEDQPNLFNIRLRRKLGTALLHYINDDRWKEKFYDLSYYK